MKQKEVILFKTKVQKISTNSKFKFRAIIRYFITLAIGTLVTFTLFHIKDFDVTNMKGSIQETSYKLMLVSMIVTIGFISIKLNQYAFNGMMFNIFMVLCSIGYAIYIAIHTRNITIDNIQGLNLPILLMLPIVSFSMMWYIGIAYFERRTRPFLNRYMRMKILNSILFQIMTWMIYWFMYLHSDFIKEEFKPIDLSNTIQMLHVSVIVILALLIACLALLRLKIFYKKKDNELLKSVSVSIAVIIIIPLTIWFVKTFMVEPSYTKDYLLLIIDLAAIGLGAFFTVLQTSRLSSPIVNNLIYAICIMMIWANKFAFEFTAKGDVTTLWKTSVTLISLSIILLFIYLRNNPVSAAHSTSILVFILLVSVFIFAEWFISSFPQSREQIQDALNKYLKLNINLNEILNTVVLMSAAELVTAGIIMWYITQSKVNHNLAVKIRKGGNNAKK